MGFAILILGLAVFLGAHLFVSMRGAAMSARQPRRRAGPATSWSSSSALPSFSRSAITCIRM
jgi:hypothetical protein